MNKEFELGMRVGYNNATETLAVLEAGETTVNDMIDVIALRCQYSDRPRRIAVIGTVIEHFITKQLQEKKLNSINDYYAIYENLIKTAMGETNSEETKKILWL